MEELKRALHESTIDELLYVSGINPMDMVSFLSDDKEENKKFVDEMFAVLHKYIKNNINEKLDIYEDCYGYYHLTRKDSYEQ